VQILKFLWYQEVLNIFFHFFFQLLTIIYFVGERKRVNIGTELLTNPTLLLLDEPTSGLDSTTAAQLMKTLRLLAMQGRTILTSIHQPSSQVFQSFDKLLLLADGKTIFCGHPNDSIKYFSSLGYQCPPLYNPSDFLSSLYFIFYFIVFYFFIYFIFLFNFLIFFFFK